MDAPRSLLTRLRAENVRSFARLDLELGPLTVLVGPNGAGKSNAVSVLRFLRDGARAGTEAAIIQQQGWDFFCRMGEDQLGIESTFLFDIGETNLSEFSIKWLLNNEGNVLLSYTSDQSVRQEKNSAPSIHISHDISSSDFLMGIEEEVRERMRSFLARISVSQVEPIELRSRAQRTDQNPSLHEDMGNLGAVLLAIRGTLFGGGIDRALALLVDGVTGYAVAQAGSTLVPQILYGPDDARDLGLESDGTIRLVSLLAAMYQPVPPSILVLEEPEMGLHPGVMSALAEFITEASARMQVLVTTHSPDLIDCFDLDTLRVVEKVDGETRIGPVRPQQREAVRKHLFRPSEIMRMEGLQLDLG